ncbi:MAG: CotH kinase family protein [Agathobaculum desmolans]
MNSERYSFKVEFDHYDSSITYHGLDKLSLNNLIQDSTMMKDYLTYTMMDEFGAAAPLCSHR